ncbi:MAG: alanine--glyoxylate aminotransferase family protein [Deltaproteobacteria bacterium]|nr:alanine--glyoxylate aminotransferase family protein [Deltaproteobacteria bacterium]
MSTFKKRYLLTPGPTMIPPAVVEARAKQLPHHRTPQFYELIKSVHERLKPFFCTKNDIYSLSASGSGAMEAAVMSLLSPGDTAICIDGGKFGHRWVEMCAAAGANVVTIKVENGHAVDPQSVATTLQQHPETKAVFTQFVETSTGVIFDIKSIGGHVAKTNAVLVVDAISGLGTQEFLPDAWDVDIVVAGSQKALMLPPGLGFVSVSPKAWKLIDAAKNRAFYLDLRRYRKGHESGEHPFTPAISLYIELNEVLTMIEQETVEGMWKRHAWLAEATRAGIAALGLKLFAEQPANALTAVAVPNGVDGGKLVKTMRDDLGVTIAGGQAELKGKIFRIAHLGYIDRFDVLTGLAALEMALKRQHYSVEIGRGVTAAEKVLVNDPQ